jgi:hypothetical protein
MESRFQHDFSKVRVHTDEKAASSARALNALAYTSGQDVVFAASQYAPETDAGQRLLAHELMHVVQQGDGETESFSPIASAPHEQEAHQAAAAIASPSLGGVPRSAAGPVHGVQCLDPSSSNPTVTPTADSIYIKAHTVIDQKPLPWGEFSWPIQWDTNGTDGYIVQEIRLSENIWNCDQAQTPYVETNPQAIEEKPPSHFWEAWRVAADGRFYPDKGLPFYGGDNWTRPAHPNTSGNWENSATVHWAKSLDPTFGVGTVVKRSQLPSTTTQPKNLSPTLLTRHASGEWKCDGTHTAK